MEEIKSSNKEFKPSYMKNDNQSKKSKKRNIKSKKNIVIIIVIAIILVVAITGLVFLFNQNRYKGYYEFEAQMKNYGFDRVYDNGSANTKEKVTKSEAVKMVVSAVYNTSDIEGIASAPSSDYSNAIWVEFAQKIGIITTTDVNENNADDYATYADVIRYFSNAKNNVLKINLDTEDKGIVKDINQYNMDEKFGILDMVNNNIIILNPSKIKARKKVFKGQVNELVVNFVNQYNTITLKNEKLNINEDKIPENASEYPYTVISVDKEAYEVAFSGKEDPNFKSPVELFPDQKEYYYQIKNNTEGYYNYLLNIDYTTISEERLKKDLRKYLLFDLDDKIVKEYVEYVKTNRIKLSGTAKVQIPVIYYDGTYYRVRTKIEFKVDSANTTQNLLYRDLVDGNTKIYDQEEYSFYIDTYMSNSFGNKTLYNVEKSFYDMLIQPLNSNIKLAGESYE
ncbi:MAG: hypothetical protein Q4D02_00095 [Clostridia bacterium]|nr:hypothetical protein [Clostridia bacterium]